MKNSSLHLSITKIFFGKFSYQYQNRKINSPSRAFNSNYLNPCSKLTALNHYAAAFVNRTDSIPIFQSGEKLSFGNSKFGETFRQIRRKNSRFHCYDIDKYQNYFWRRYGIKERMHNYGVTRIFHFLDNYFFFGELFFKDNQKIEVDSIKKTLLTKYLGQQTKNVDGNFRIEFNDGLIFFEDTGINLSVKYIFTGSEIINRKLSEISPKTFNGGIDETSEFSDFF